MSRMRIGPVVLAAMVAACGGGAAVTTTGATLGATTSTAAVPSTTTTIATGSVADSQCDAQVTEIELGFAFDGSITGRSQPPPERLYFCVVVPDGTTGVTIELTGATAALNLFVGYPDLVTLQEGGVFFWVGEEVGDGVTVEVQSVGGDFVDSGTYYIEVSPDDFTDSSPFTLLVSATY